MPFLLRSIPNTMFDMALSGSRLLSTARSNLSLRPSAETLIWLTTAALLVGGSLLPEANADMLNEVGRGLISLLPAVAIAALLAGVLTVGRWSDRALDWLKGGLVRTVVTASLIGAITPVCGLGMLPLIATPSPAGPSPRPRHGILGLLTGDRSQYAGNNREHHRCPLRGCQDCVRPSVLVCWRGA